MMQAETSSNMAWPSDSEMLLLLSDALDAGLRLLVDGPKSDDAQEQILLMLQGFAEEASHLFASSAIEPSGRLFEMAARARESRELRHLVCLSQQLHHFLQQARPNWLSVAPTD